MPPNTAPVRLRQKSADLAAEDLADGLSNHLQCQAVAAIAQDEVGPVLRVTRQVFGGQEHPAIGDLQTAQLECANGATTEHGPLGRRFATGHDNARLVARFAHRAQHGSIASQPFAVARVALTGLEQRFEIVQDNQAGALAEQL